MGSSSGKVSVMTGRKCSLTSSLPEAMEGNVGNHPWRRMSRPPLLSLLVNKVAELVLSTAQLSPYLIESVVAGLNSQEDTHPIVNIPSSAVPVSDLAAIVWSVSLGDDSEDEGLPIHLPAKPADALSTALAAAQAMGVIHKAAKSPANLTKSSSVSVARPLIQLILKTYVWVGN